tara:strand:+ start:37 stop:1062 length:1026 start_codon:yes stop_codon:yes gene_type:complete
MRIKIDNFEKIILLGGGRLLIALAKWCKCEGESVFVVTSPRHAEEIIESGKSFVDILSIEKISYIVVEEISSNEVKNYVGDLTNAFSLSISAAWIFKEEILKTLFKGKLFNLHGTKLPQNRGGGGFSWQILMGNRFGFCQLHLVDSGVDTGEIVETDEFLYPPSCRIPRDYENVSYEKYLNFMIKFIKKIRQYGLNVETFKQTEYFSSYFPRLNTLENGWINWDDHILDLEKFICAFDEPYAGAKCLWRGKTVIIKKVCVDFSDQSFHPYQNGIVYRINKNWLCVCANGGSLIIEKIYCENGKSILQDIRQGDRFINDPNAMQNRFNRVIYTPKGLLNKRN